MTDKPEIRVLSDLCTVKNASLFFDYQKGIYHLVHYDTEILTIMSNPDNKPTVIKALKCSNSSTRAIKQVCNNLGIDMPKLQPFDKFVKYNMSTTVYKTKNQLKEIIQN